MAGNYFRETLYLRYFAGFLISLWEGIEKK